MRIIFFMITILVGCVETDNKFIYENNRNISNIRGKVYSYGSFYFPENMFIDTIKETILHDIRINKSIPIGSSISEDSVRLVDSIYTKIDSIGLEWYSKFLYESNEPTLCNYFLGDKICRLTIIQSFFPSIIIRICESENMSRMTCKKIVGFSLIDEQVYDENDNLIGLKKNEAKIIQDTTYEVSKDIMTNLLKLIDLNSYLKMPNKKRIEGALDGSNWILEYHTKNKYWVVDRWSPKSSRDSNFREICDYLISQSVFSNNK